MRYGIHYSGNLRQTFVRPKTNISGVLYFDSPNDTEAKSKASIAVQEEMREEGLELHSPPYLRRYDEFDRPKEIIYDFPLEMFPSETIR